MTKLLYFRSPGLGFCRLDPRYATRKNLSELFAIDERELIVADAEGNEVVCDDESGDALAAAVSNIADTQKFDTFTVVDAFTLEHSDHDCATSGGECRNWAEFFRAALGDEKTENNIQTKNLGNNAANDVDNKHRDNDNDDDCCRDNSACCSSANEHVVGATRRQEDATCCEDGDGDCCSTKRAHRDNSKEDVVDVDEISDSDDGHIFPCRVQFELTTRLRQRTARIVAARTALITRLYKPKHSYLFERPLDLRRVLVDDIYEALIERNESKVRALTRAVSERTRLYSMQLFRAEFCAHLIEEIEAFESSGLPTSRPNSMNNYGVILDEIGLRDAICDLQERVAKPIVEIFYQSLPGVDSIDDHHAFVVQYAVDDSGDSDLGFHYDESEFTMNVCLGKEFAGSELYFSGWLADESTHDEQLKVAHEVGRGLFHIGKHRHGALKIERGQRFNLILWMRSSALRKPRCCEHC